MARRDSPLYIAPRALPALAAWLWRFRRHCNARDYSAGVRALALLNRGTLDAFRAIAAGGIGFEMREDGVLFAFLDPRAAAAAMRDFELIGRHGYPVPESLDGDEARRLEPALSPRVAAAVLVRGEAQLRPEALVAGLVRALARDGAEMRFEERVTSIVRRENAVRALRTGRGELTGDRFVIAAGRGSHRSGLDDQRAKDGVRGGAPGAWQRSPAGWRRNRLLRPIPRRIRPSPGRSAERGSSPPSPLHSPCITSVLPSA